MYVKDVGFSFACYYVLMNIKIIQVSFYTFFVGLFLLYDNSILSTMAGKIVFHAPLIICIISSWYYLVNDKKQEDARMVKIMGGISLVIFLVLFFIYSAFSDMRIGM